MTNWQWELCRTPPTSTRWGPPGTSRTETIVCRWDVSSTWRTGQSGSWGIQSTISNTAHSYQVCISIGTWAVAIKVLEFHTREIFPSHREVTIVVNKEEDKFTGTSGGGKSLQGWHQHRTFNCVGTIAWKLSDHQSTNPQSHLILMWSIPYNLNIFNSYFAVGMVKLNSKFRQEGAVGELSLSWYFQLWSAALLVQPDDHLQRRFAR